MEFKFLFVISTPRIAWVIKMTHTVLFCCSLKYLMPIFLTSFVETLLIGRWHRYVMNIPWRNFVSKCYVITFWWRHQFSYIRYLRWPGRSILIQYSKANCIFQMYFTRTTPVLHWYYRIEGWSKWWIPPKKIFLISDSKVSSTTTCPKWIISVKQQKILFV